jgi:hypothetical protein
MISIHRNAFATNCFKGPQQDVSVIAIPPTMLRSTAAGCRATLRPKTALQNEYVVIGRKNDDDDAAKRANITGPEGLST